MLVQFFVCLFFFECVLWKHTNFIYFDVFCILLFDELFLLIFFWLTFLIEHLEKVEFLRLHNKNFIPRVRTQIFADFETKPSPSYHIRHCSLKRSITYFDNLLHLKKAFIYFYRLKSFPHLLQRTMSIPFGFDWVHVVSICLYPFRDHSYIT